MKFKVGDMVTGQMKYPRYTREQKLSCKLTERDILNIKIEYSTGFFTHKALAKKYRVSVTTIKVSINPVKRKMNYKLYITPEQNRERQRTFMERKKKLQPEITTYMNGFIKEKMDNNPEYRKKRLGDIYKSQRKASIKKEVREIK